MVTKLIREMRYTQDNTRNFKSSLTKIFLLPLVLQAIIRFEGEGEAKAAWESAVTDATDGKVMVKEVEVQGRLLEGIKRGRNACNQQIFQ